MFHQRSGRVPSPDGALLKGDAIKVTLQHLRAQAQECLHGRRDKPRPIPLYASYFKAHPIKKNHTLFNERIYVWMCISLLSNVYIHTHIYMLWDTYIQIIPFRSHFGINQSFFTQSVPDTTEAYVKCHDCHIMGSEILEPAPNPSLRRHFQRPEGQWRPWILLEMTWWQAMDKTLKSAHLITPTPRE